jgi:hypothetical protein
MRDDWTMTDGVDQGSDERAAQQGAGMLANLPRTRPQRASARRVAARRTASRDDPAGPSDGAPAPAKRVAKAAAGSTSTAAKPAQTGSRPKVTPGAKTSVKDAAGSKRGSVKSAKPKPKPAAGVKRPAKAARRPRSAPEYEPAPRQGFAAEEDGLTGSVQPPGGAELVASATEIIGELAKSGLATGERLLKDVFSRLSPS